ncbi:N-acetylneuraminate synthase family protein [uncultured Desulfobacter sp.]|uniref:N-acetylneuraminate synthase family protein n=1 Tax=uncultured Desulfobacter sp. TaxID=240139 RepID=UPI0029C95A4D|nr:N-acetylneuraminate synthase family protein [uncultured Desulfobacter sp.]
MKRIKIMDHSIGNGHPPFIIAELGICHEGNVNLALELTKEAINAGAHAVKTETFQSDKMIFDTSATTSYVINGEKTTVPLDLHMKQFELSLEEHHEVKKLCDRHDVPFISTAHDFDAIDFLCDINAAAIKIASPDLIHYPLLAHAAQKGTPVIMDTGGALQYEIELAVQTLRANGLDDIMINHNPVGHPAPADKHDLAIIPRLQMLTALPVGISDHYDGYEMLYAATAIGANILEKPISMDRFDPMPEKGWSISVPDMELVFSTVRQIHQAIGQPERKMSKEAQGYRNQNRMALAAKKDLQKGDRIIFENITFGRPREGIGVEHWDIVQGMKLRNDKKRHQFIHWKDLNE